MAVPNDKPRNITGIVTDADNIPLIGAMIFVNETKKGSITDMKGKFEMLIPANSSKLIISSSGYQSQEIKLSSQSNYNIKLQIKKSNNVVIRGYPKSRTRTESESFSEESYSVLDDMAPASKVAPSPPAFEPMKGMPVATDKYKKSKFSSEGSDTKTDKLQNSAGQMTAGEWNDLNNWEAWNNLVKETDYQEMEDFWSIDASNRVSVFVQNQYELPIPDCSVTISKGDEIIWSSKTDNAGKAELWISGSLEELTLLVKSKSNSFHSPVIKKFSEGVNLVQFREECSAPKQAEIMFVVDATGSMGDEIDFLKTELSDVINRVKIERNEIDFKWGSVFYRDQTDEYLTLQSPLNSNSKNVLDFIKMQSAGGGGDYPEAVNEGLEEALMQEWSEEAIARIIFLVLDAPPHHDPEVLKDLQSQIAFASSMGIKIIPITASGINRQTEFLMKFMSIMTNGTYVFVTDHSGIGNKHLDPIVSDFQVEKLNDLLVRIIRNYTDPMTCKSQEQSDAISTQIEIFPNPTLDFVHLKIPSGVKKMSLTTNTGQLLHQEAITDQTKISIDMNSYVDGMYFVLFYTSDQVYNYKVIKGSKV